MRVPSTVKSLVLLFFFLFPSFAPLVEGSAQSVEDCVFSEENPLVLTPPPGHESVVTCVDGVFTVTYEQPIYLAEEQPLDESFEVSSPPLGQSPPGGWVEPMLTTWNSCVGWSAVYEAANLQVTYYNLTINWSWTGGRIRQVSGTWGSWARTTENSTIAPGDWSRTNVQAYWHISEYSSTGYWMRQALQGWASFQFQYSPRYPHTHHMTVYVDRKGNCSATQEFYGTVPGSGGKHRFGYFKE